MRPDRLSGWVGYSITHAEWFRQFPKQVDLGRGRELPTLTEDTTREWIFDELLFWYTQRMGKRGWKQCPSLWQGSMGQTFGAVGRKCGQECLCLKAISSLPCWMFPITVCVAVRMRLEYLEGAENRTCYKLRQFRKMIGCCLNAFLWKYGQAHPIGSRPGATSKHNRGIIYPVWLQDLWGL